MFARARPRTAWFVHSAWLLSACAFDASVGPLGGTGGLGGSGGFGGSGGSDGGGEAGASGGAGGAAGSGAGGAGGDAPTPCESGKECGAGACVGGVCVPVPLVRFDVDPAFVSEPLTDFPVLVRVTLPELTAAKPDGTDLLFSLDGSVVPLAYELERWDASTGELAAWVRLPSIEPAIGASFFLRYADGGTLDRSNPPAVWSAGYGAVFHFTAPPDGAQTDSTGNGNTLVPHTTVCANAAPTSAPDGITGGALSFGEHTCDRLRAPPNASLKVAAPAQVTLSTWLRSDGAGYYQALIARRNKDTEQGNYQLSLHDGTTTPSYFVGNAAGNYSGAVAVAPASVAVGQWTHVAVVVNATGVLSGECTFYVDAQPFAGGSLGCGLAGADEVPLFVGGLAQQTDEPTLGDLDEPRVSLVGRSAAWLRAEFENQRPGSTFLQVSVVP